MTVSTAAVGASVSSSVAKKSKVKKVLIAHPPYGDMIKSAVTELKERGGSSRQAIAKYIKAEYKLDEGIDSHLRRALVSAVKSGKIVHTKGIGASGSFKLVDKVSGVLTKKKVVSIKPKSPKHKATPKKKGGKKQVAKPKAVVSSTTISTSAVVSTKPKTVKSKVLIAKKPKTPKKKMLKPKKPQAKKTPKKGKK